MSKIEIKRKFREIFKRERKELGLSQKDLAKRMGVPQSTIARIESGELNVTGVTLLKFLDATGLQVVLEQEKTKKKGYCKVDALQVVNQVLKYAKQKLGEDYDITNMKLNKLLYYIQLFAVGRFNIPIIREDLQAWPHGPVFPSVYLRFKDRRNQIIPPNDRLVKRDTLPLVYKQIINDVVDEYGQMSAYQLRGMTHRESPWFKAVRSKSRVIKEEDLRNWYRHILLVRDRKM